MILGVYSIQDRLTGYLQPTFEVNDAVALRNFEHAVLSGGSLLDSHAVDYVLCRIGSLDDQTGVLTPVDPIQQIVTARAVLLKSMNQEVRHDSR